MQVDVYNREQAVDLEPTEGTVMISISAPNDPASIKDGWEDVLRLEFDDVVKVRNMPEIVAFNHKHVDAIHEFVEKHAAASKDFAVHCDAGWSRSTAVGMYLNEVYGGDINLHAIGSDFSKANSRVHRGLMRKHWKKRFAAMYAVRVKEIASDHMLLEISGWKRGAWVRLRDSRGYGKSFEISKYPEIFGEEVFEILLKQAERFTGVEFEVVRVEFQQI